MQLYPLLNLSAYVWKFFISYNTACDTWYAERLVQIRGKEREILTACEPPQGLIRR